MELTNAPTAIAREFDQALLSTGSVEEVRLEAGRVARSDVFEVDATTSP